MTTTNDTDDWQVRAECLGVPTDVFYPPPNAGPGSLNLARSFCLRCSVRYECLAWALDNINTKDDEGGMWGGTTAAERRKMRRREAKFKKQLEGI